MFDVFQNVLFGKKKSSTDSEKEKTDADDFVVLGQTSNEQAVKDPDSNPTDFPFPKNPYSYWGDSSLPAVPKTEEKKDCPIMPLQDVPFTLNSALLASTKLDQIWSGMSPILSSISQYKPYRDDYDFSLEKSVIAETVQK